MSDLVPTPEEQALTALMLADAKVQRQRGGARYQDDEEDEEILDEPDEVREARLQVEREHKEMIDREHRERANARRKGANKAKREKAARAAARRSNSPRNVARLAGERYYKLGRPCIHGHDGMHLTSSGNCVACYRAKRKSPKC
jgi:hypothetical protein